MYCGEASLVNHGAYRARAVTLRCRAWTCPDCASLRRRNLIAQIAGGRPERLVTLTLRHAPGDDQEAHARFLVVSFQRLALALRRSVCPRLQYFAVLEAHPGSGYAHLHIAQRGGYIDHALLRRLWSSLTGSWNVDIRAVRNRSRCGSYIAKYLGKDPRRFGTLKRYWASRRWDQTGFERPERDLRFGVMWEPRNTPLRELARAWLAMGWSLWWEDYDLHGSRSPPDDPLAVPYHA